MRNLIVGNMLSLGGERVLKFSELQLNDTPHTAYGLGCARNHRRTGREGQGGSCPPKQITKSKSRANIQHKSGKKWENKKAKSPQFVVQIKVVVQYSQKSWAIFAIYSSGKFFLIPKMVH